MLLINTSEGNCIDYGSTENQPTPKIATDQNTDYKNGGPIHCTEPAPHKRNDAHQNWSAILGLGSGNLREIADEICVYNRVSDWTTSQNPSLIEPTVMKE